MIGLNLDKQKAIFLKAAKSPKKYFKDPLYYNTVLQENVGSVYKASLRLCAKTKS